jgi:hypothetical protein
MRQVDAAVLRAQSSWLIAPTTTVGRSMISRSTAFAILKRPQLWVAAFGALLAFARPGWWRRAPFLPVPDDELIRWRTATAYGSDDVDLVSNDVVAYLEWRKRSAQGQTRGG